MYTPTISALALLSTLSLVTADATLTVPFATVTYPTGAPSGVSAAVSAAQSDFSAAQSALSSIRSAAQSDASSIRSVVQSDVSAAQSAASAAGSAFSSARSEVNSYQSSLLANPSVKSLIDQVTNVLPTGSYTNLGALETFAVDAPSAFLAAYGPAISTASFYSALSAQESSIQSEYSALGTSLASSGVGTTLAASTVAATTVPATTVSGSTIPATTVAATTIAAVTAAATAAAAPLASKAAMGVVGLAAGVVGIAML